MPTNVSIRTKTINDYSGGLSTSYGGLQPWPQLWPKLLPAQLQFCQDSSFFTLTKAVVVKIETPDGKLVSESSNVLPK
ncbi:Keratin, type II cytoskeletal 8 [Sciurus carolinensis]|uniref:Keratin, type II cytoskeletal 8 n=1 Tax=Sciurus carolinensis TaxID=30640 RepID=A0AA41MD77_SCICA|nr:Keratin, type II cytoskeletal 8 [Sciurus carolinensis]